MKMDIQEVGYGDMDYMELYRAALVNAVMNLRIP